MTAYLSRWWPFNSHGYKILSAQQNETQGSFFFSFSSFAFWFHSSKFIAISKNDIHVLVKCFESPYDTNLPFNLSPRRKVWQYKKLPKSIITNIILVTINTSILHICFTPQAIYGRPMEYGRPLYFHPVVSSSSFFPRLILAIADWISAILAHTVWP